MGKVCRVSAVRGSGKNISQVSGCCMKSQRRIINRKISLPEEGSGDSFDDTWSVQPTTFCVEAPCAEDGWDSTGFLSPPTSSRVAVIVRLSTPSRTQMSEPCYTDTPLELADEENADMSIARSELGFQSFGGASGVAGAATSPSDGCDVSTFDKRQLSKFLMTSDEGRARKALVESLSQAALHVGAGPRVLYLASVLLDAGLKMSRHSGRRMDSVQRQVLGVTCLYLACNQSTPFSSADEFCIAAGLGQGSVKGCMITRQQQVVEGLLPCSLYSPSFSARVLWDANMQIPGEVSKEEHMAQFVLHLAGTEFGSRYWDRVVVASAVHVLSGQCASRNGSQLSVKTLENYLLPPVKESTVGSIACGAGVPAGTPLSPLQQCGHASGKRQSSVFVKQATVACG